ncbi:LGFP repeat-containing protein [Rhodococcus sp. ACPA1]|uniref:LGFP repeat-containing protein n=1 Tax=Rhodococcus sp. ACPA1 TaxID=2028572 RepID=UPI000BB10E75|nr:hypothetical protein [Rhodococcus sp. ACPA1]PBC57406.1 hypothetical protein CJ177_10625 [Rhodococcus sp. ACPA1]
MHHDHITCAGVAEQRLQPGPFGGVVKPSGSSCRSEGILPGIIVEFGFSVGGAKWGNYGYEGGFIKYPTTDEILNPDGVGRRQHVQGADIYWNVVPGAHVIGGAIKDKWNTVGSEQNGSLLGYPTTDEIILPGGAGRMNRFERGVIYWSPATSAHPVTGKILEYWSSLGYEAGQFGYPVGDEYAFNSGRAQDFQNGRLDAYQTDPSPLTFRQAAGGAPQTAPFAPSALCDTAVDHPHASVGFKNQIHANVRAYCYYLPTTPTIEVEAEMTHLRWGGIWPKKPNINKDTGQEEDFHLGPTVTESVDGTYAAWCDRGSWFRYAIDAFGTLTIPGDPDPYHALASYETPSEIQCEQPGWPQ